MSLFLSTHTQLNSSPIKNLYSIKYATLCSKSEFILIVLGLPYVGFKLPLMFDSALNCSEGIFFKSETENYYGEIFNEPANVSSTVSQTCIHAILVCMNNQGQSIKSSLKHSAIELFSQRKILHYCQVVRYLAVFTLTLHVLKKIQFNIIVKLVVYIPKICIKYRKHEKKFLIYIQLCVALGTIQVLRHHNYDLFWPTHPPYHQMSSFPIPTLKMTSSFPHTHLPIYRFFFLFDKSGQN